MRIFYISESELPSASANSVQVMRMCEAFAQQGHEVRLLGRVPAGNSTARSPASDSELDPLFDYYGTRTRFQIERLTYRNRWAGRSQYALRAWWRARRWRAEAVFARCITSATWCARAGLPTIVELHGIPRPGSQLRTSVLPRLLSMPALRGAICISQMLRSDLLSTFSCDPERVHVFHDGADACDAKAGTEVALDEAFANRLRAIKRPWAGYLGSLFPGKGMEVVVPLARRMPQVSFVVVGGDRSSLAQLKRETSDIENLHLLGRVSPGEAAAVCQQFDVALLPNQHRVSASSGVDIGRWTSPLKAFEYMAAGRPIVASSIPVLEEVFSDDCNALLADPEDIEQWAAAVERLLTDATQANRLGQTAFDDFAAQYTWEQRASRILEACVAPAEVRVSRA